MLEIHLIKIDDLKPYEKNPRKNDDAVEYVANSIKEFGFKVPIVIDSNNVIVAGHTRYKAAKQLGMEELPCIIADDLTDDQIKAYRLADNKVAEFSEWDFSLLEEEMSNLFDFEMDLFGFEDQEEEQYEDIDDNDNGDTTTFEHKLKCGKIEVVLTDDEYKALLDKYNEYVEENGVSFGFVWELLKND